RENPARAISLALRINADRVSQRHIVVGEFYPSPLDLQCSRPVSLNLVTCAGASRWRISRNLARSAGFIPAGAPVRSGKFPSPFAIQPSCGLKSALRSHVHPSESPEKICRIWRRQTCIGMERAINDQLDYEKNHYSTSGGNVPGASAGVRTAGCGRGCARIGFHSNFKPSQIRSGVPRGTPRQLVEAIEKASGKPLNAVIPDEDAGLRLPALKMRAVNVWELFQALSVSSRRTIQTTRGVASVEYGFSTVGNLSENSIWYFYQHKPDPFEEKKACRFYQLDPYLDTFKVEDITTAIQTGWKMLGETNPP